MSSAPERGRVRVGWVVLLALAMVCGPFRPAAAESDGDEKEPLLWSVPKSGSLVLAPLTGWSTGSQYDGPLVGMRAMFVFEHFIGGVVGQSIFVDSGAVYLFGLDLHGRYGPFYGGLAFAGHFIPGASASGTTPSMGFQAGVHFPTPFSFVFLEAAYRVNILFHAGRQEAYHTFLLGVLFESGT